MRKCFSLILILFLIGFISAGYVCSTNFDEDKKEINVFESASVNGLKIGVISSYSSAAGGGIYYANLMIDGERFVLTDEDNSSDFEIQNGEGTIELINASGYIANIEIDGDSENIEIDESASFGDYIVYITDVEGDYPGNAEVKGFVGQEKINLNKDEIEKKVTVEDIEYVVELFSATNGNVIIIVKECNNGTISYVEDIEEENETLNETINQTSNETEVENDFNETNQTESNNTEGINEVANQVEESLFSKIIGWGSILIFTIIIVMIIFFWSISKRKEKEEEKKIDVKPPPKNTEAMQKEDSS